MSELICPLAYRRDGKRKPIICRYTEKICAHQYWCDIKVEYKQHADAAECPGQEAYYGGEKDAEHNR